LTGVESVRVKSKNYPQTYFQKEGTSRGRGRKYNTNALEIPKKSERSRQNRITNTEPRVGETAKIEVIFFQGKRKRRK